MAVLGIQFVLSLARWLLCSMFAGLVRYLHPSNEELRVFAPAAKLAKKDNKKQRKKTTFMLCFVGEGLKP